MLAMKPHTYSDQQVEQLSRQWVEQMVVGLNLCPFAAPVVRNDSIRYAISEALEPEALVADFLQELDLIQQLDEQELSTTLLIIPQMLEQFDDFLDLLDICQQLLEEAGLDGVFQLASFHPGYLFEGVEEDDLSHWTNRAPFPMIHIIREGEMARVLMYYKDPEQIPERNMDLMRQLGRDGLVKQYPPLADYWPE